MVKFGIKKDNEEGKNGQEHQPVDLSSLKVLEDDLDDEDEEVFRKYREQRMAELINFKAKRTFGEVREISGIDFVDEVTKADPDTWVVIHLYKAGIPLCTLINRSLIEIASSFPETKFLKSISTVCIPNFPDENLPGLLIYKGGKCQKQIFGSHHFSGCDWSTEILEWLIHSSGAIKSDLTEDPRKEARKSNKAFVSTYDSDED